MIKKFNFAKRIAEETRIFKNVSAYTLTSRLQLDKLKQLYGEETGSHGNNYKIIPPGVNAHKYRLSTNEDNQVEIDLPEPYIFCLSRIDTHKGHSLLLQAFDIVRLEFPSVNLVIGGGSPKPGKRELEVYDEMENIIAERGMRENVHIIGYVPDKLMRPYYQQSLFFVMPSKYEPLGMTAMEAMACGKAVVASKFGGIKNIITNGENGFLVDPANSQEFAEVMVKLIKDPRLAKNVGYSAHNYIVKHYSWEIQAQKHVELYNTAFG